MPNHDRFECQTVIDSDAILHMLSGIGGPLLAALLFDITGSYVVAFEIYAAIAVFGGLALLGASIVPRMTPNL